MFGHSGGGHYDEKGRWHRTKFCFVSCGARCNCTPPMGRYYDPKYDKQKQETPEKPADPTAK